MEQLFMLWLAGTPFETRPLPDGYSVSNYKTEDDKVAWVECCKKGLVADDATTAAFDESMDRAGLNVYEDVFFLDYKGEHVGTVTAFVHAADGLGDMHMVGIREDFRGKGLAGYLNQITLTHLTAKGVKMIHLSTDDWRKAAVKSYVAGGFLPVNYADDMEGRWQALVNELNVPRLQMVKADGTPDKVLYKR